MKILICGANGFLGRHLTTALEQAGHTIVAGVRRRNTRQTEENSIEIEYTKDTQSAVWKQRLASYNENHTQPIEIVINAIGILNESKTQPFNNIHSNAPIALFQAAIECGIKGIVQISALGGSNENPASYEPQFNPASTPYLQSKRRADAFLLESQSNYLILRPSVVVGIDGASSQLFRTLASLPLISLPGQGAQQLQPVHVDDICLSIVNWLNQPERSSQLINAVGPAPISYKQMLATYRQQMGLATPVFLPIPMALMKFTAQLATLLPQNVLTPDTMRMLEQDNIADPEAFTRILGKSPKSSENWLSDIPAELVAAAAIHSWFGPLSQIILSLIWLITGALSLGIYPVSESLTLIARLGITGPAALNTLYAAACLDLVFGIASLVRPARSLWFLQILIIGIYSAIICLALPEYLIHPFGPVLKNLAVLSLCLYLVSTSKSKK